MVVVSVTLPADLLKKFDSFTENRGYYSRSEGFRDALRNLMSEFRPQEEQYGRVVAAMMVTCEYPGKDIVHRLIRLAGDSDDIVIENLHRHLGDHDCLGVLIAEGTVQKIREFAGRIARLGGIQQVKTVWIPMKQHGRTSVDDSP